MQDGQGICVQHLGIGLCPSSHPQTHTQTNKHKYSHLQGSGGQQRDRLVGPTHILQTVHQGDGCALDVAVRVVKRSPPARSFWVVLHPHLPHVGRHDLRDWLSDGAWASKVKSAMAAHAAATSGAHQRSHKPRRVSSISSSSKLSKQGSRTRHGANGAITTKDQDQLSPRDSFFRKSPPPRVKEGGGEGELVFSALADRMRGGAGAPSKAPLKSPRPHQTSPNGGIDPLPSPPIPSSSQLLSPTLDVEIFRSGPTPGAKGGGRVGSSSPDQAPLVVMDSPLDGGPMVPGEDMVLAPLEEDVLAAHHEAEGLELGAVTSAHRVAHWVRTDGIEFATVTPAALAAAQSPASKMVASPVGKGSVRSRRSGSGSGRAGGEGAQGWWGGGGGGPGRVVVAAGVVFFWGGAEAVRCDDCWQQLWVKKSKKSEGIRHISIVGLETLFRV